jgi:hypothetical protein
MTFTNYTYRIYKIGEKYKACEIFESIYNHGQ